jgi:hypothetical protein
MEDLLVVRSIDLVGFRISDFGFRISEWITACSLSASHLLAHHLRKSRVIFGDESSQLSAEKHGGGRNESLFNLCHSDRRVFDAGGIRTGILGGYGGFAAANRVGGGGVSNAEALLALRGTELSDPGVLG